MWRDGRPEQKGRVCSEAAEGNAGVFKEGGVGGKILITFLGNSCAARFLVLSSKSGRDSLLGPYIDVGIQTQSSGLAATGHA